MSEETEIISSDQNKTDFKSFLLNNKKIFIFILILLLGLIFFYFFYLENKKILELRFQNNTIDQ